ncbi:hypothetical protein [Wielerella bovis]|uniref:hypothetical protein n=1 Tax=Wielerella bovis TaxID=2917790 RepID=UPI002018CF2D|nr:hypothetical protein [Wielerella bovis]ULJ65365.1 hypothetical protein MIS33_03585 [Wielerella bovis]ULJ67712.1 hypothetical protein MIS31_03960 [Wielerella bovis]
MSEHWKTKSDRAHAHQLLEKAWLAEFDAEKTHIIQKAAAMKNGGDIWDLAQEMREFCRDSDHRYTLSFSNMDMKIMRLYNWGFLHDDDLAGFTEKTRTWLLRLKHTEEDEDLRLKKQHV